jgi:23S rRNA (adenine2030-N6)-methyltransferase
MSPRHNSRAVNYRHAFHAGNHADALKHLALLVCLARFKAKPAPFFTLDTHAGAGAYDLTSAAAQRSPEWRDGIGALIGLTDTPPALAAYLEAVRALNPDTALTRYPGSPALIAGAMRPQDRYAACELHPEEAAQLRAALRGTPAQIHVRDGWDALKALLPPPEKRGLVLVDPPYEAPDELARAARAIAEARTRFAHGTYLWWRPLKAPGALDAADAEARAGLPCEVLRADLWRAPPRRDGPMTASSILVLNPPFGLRAALDEALPVMAAALGDAAGQRVRAS